jgi:hypothetical protein
VFADNESSRMEVGGSSLFICLLPSDGMRGSGLGSLVQRYKVTYSYDAESLSRCFRRWEMYCDLWRELATAERPLESSASIPSRLDWAYSPRSQLMIE